MKNIFLILFIMQFGHHKILAQKTPPKDSVKTASSLLSAYEAQSGQLKILPPNVASIEQYGNVPINFSTGQLGFGFPLLKIDLDANLSIPIQLSYNNTGLKPEQVPTWVGNGWDLSVGGTIVQYINGLSDLGTTGLSNPTIRQDLNDFFSGSMVNPAKYLYAKDVEEGLKDSQFDIFSFNFLGRSGKFYFDNGNVFFLNYMPFKVTYSSGQFTIIDEKGYQFSFSNVITSSGAYTDGFIYTNADPFVVNSKTWYLSKITTPTGVEANFTYVSDIDYSISADGVAYSAGAYVLTGGGCGFSNSFSYQGTSSNAVISQLLLSEINWKGKKVNFITTPRNDLKDQYSNLSKALSRIEMKNESNQTVKQIGFEYSYLNSNDRLKLNNVSVLDNVTSTKTQTHSFEYYDSILPIPIPSLKYLGGINAVNNSVDHWGYYNGKTNSNKIPNRDYSSFVPYSGVWGGADRSSDNISSKIGMLKKIIYPTKGYTAIEYEANTVNYASYSQIPVFLQNQNASSYTTFYTSSVATCTNGGYVNGQFTVSQPIIGAKITWNIATNSADDVSRFTLSKNGVTIINDFSQAAKTGILNTDLSAGVYTYTLEPGCVSSDAPPEPIATVSFFIQSPVSPNGGIDVAVGGNRVSKITDYADATGTNERIISYEEASLLAPPFYISTIEQGHGAGFTSNPCVSCGDRYLLGENSVYAWDGFHVEYRKVDELVGLNGKKTFRYHGNYFVGGPNTQSPYPSTQNLNWRSGNLLSQEVYQKVVSGFDLTQKTENVYVPLNIYPLTKNGLKVGKKLACPFGSSINPVDNVNYNYAILPVFTDKFGTQSTTNIEYFNGNSLSSTSSFTYNTDWLQNKITRQTSDNQTEEELVFYANDYTNIVGTNIAALKTKNMIGLPLKIIKKFNNNIIEGILINNDALGNPIEIYKYENSSLIPNNHNSSIFFEPNFNLYESRKYSSTGNMIEANRNDGISETFVWANSHSYPIANVQNATKAIVEANVGSLESIAALSSNCAIENIGTTLRNNLTNALVSSGTLISGVGLNKITASNSQKNTFEYDGINRLTLSKDNQDNLTNKYAYSYATTAPSSCTTPAAPSISVSSSTLCNVSLSATGCAGIINWSNGQSGASISVTTSNSANITATCSVGTCTSLVSNILSIPVLPTGWQAIDVGSSTVNGCTQYNSGVLTMQSDGPNNGIGGADPDKFHFVYKTFTGDVSVITKLTGMTAGDGNRSGIMIRNSLDPKAVMFSVIQDNNNAVGKLLRNSENGNSHLWQFNGANLNNTWIRLDKVGNIVTARFSTLANPNPAISTDWQEMLGNTGNPAPSMTWNGSFYLGFVSMAYPSGSNNTIFSNLSVNGAGL